MATTLPELSETDLALLRDEVGTAEPSDNDLYAMYEELASWRKVALRVLKRRRAAAVGTSQGTLTSLSVPGAVALGYSRADLASLDRQIERLTAAVAAEDAGTDVPEEDALPVVRSGRITRRRTR